MTMIPKFNSFDEVIKHAAAFFPDKPSVHTDTWQGVNISKKPEMAMHEILFYSFMVPLLQDEEPRDHPDLMLDWYRQDINPNLPWADDHFQERIHGEPLNPGETWQWWPYNKSASTFLDHKGQFNHNYMERYWPKHANCTPEGKIPADYLERTRGIGKHGIRFKYGDLGDVINLLWEDPLTRQAYLPIWFPEDTGQPENGRKPCTLGYHFIMRDGQLHCTYYIRSCDYVRHFRDDIYLTVRLQLWLLKCLQARARATEKPGWDTVKPGMFIMHIVSLHMFRNDYLIMKGK